MAIEGRKSLGEQPTTPIVAQDLSKAGRERTERDMQIEQEKPTSDTAAEPAVDQGVRDHLGRKLKESYDDLVRQPVPDKFRQLLEDLERREKGQ